MAVASGLFDNTKELLLTSATTTIASTQVSAGILATSVDLTTAQDEGDLTWAGGTDWVQINAAGTELSYTDGTVDSTTNPVFSSPTASQNITGVIVGWDTGTPATSVLLVQWYNGSNYITGTTGGAITVTWNGSGLFAL